MANEFNASYFCFTQARCRLCQFPVHRGDVIIADAWLAAVLSSNADGENTYQAVEEGFATEFKLPHFGDFWDRGLHIKFHTCFLKKCRVREEATVCYHVDCYRDRLYSITPIFLAATEFSFTPFPEEERRRAEFNRQLLACKLEQMDFGTQSLPYELWLMVARHLVRWCALHMLECQVRTADKVGDSVLDLNQSVFASYIKIDGRYYIKRLQNTPDSRSGSGCCLLLPTRNSREKDTNIFVAEDHIGIRRLAFVSKENLEEWCRNQSSVPGAWWKNISQGVMPSAITINGDGLKVRSIQSSQMQDLALVGWPTPLSSPPLVVKLATLEPPRDPPDGLRMDFFDCNAPDTIGYSVALKGRAIAGVIAHKKGEADVRSVYEKTCPTNCYWQFMPINEGEYLTDICRLTTPPLATRQDVTGMTFTTNRDRTVFFGVYGLNDGKYKRIWKLSNNPCRLYYNDRDGFFDRSFVDFVGIQQTSGDPAKLSQENLPAPVVSISNFPRTIPNTLRFYSSCSMRHLTEVQTCGFGTGSHREILGMLLRYADGHRECVGFFRHDMILERISVGERDSLYLCVKQIEKNDPYAYVAVVTCEAPEDLSTARWLQVTQSGILEWWHSPEGAALYYNGHRLGVVYPGYT